MSLSVERTIANQCEGTTIGEGSLARPILVERSPLHSRLTRPALGRKPELGVIVQSRFHTEATLVARVTGVQSHVKHAAVKGLTGKNGKGEGSRASLSLCG